MSERRAHHNARRPPHPDPARPSRSPSSPPNEIHTSGARLELLVPDALVDAVAHRVAELLAAQPAVGSGTATSPWLDVDEAARYLRCSRQRVYDLVSEGRVRVAKEGRRSLFRREWLDAVREGA
jgi:excisionase family DNA binding protein